MIPSELKYTKEHEWVGMTGANTVRIGITHYAQEQLGDVVFVQLPAVGETVAQGDSLGEVESTKSVSDVYTPVAGEVVARNDALESQPELVNSDPYGEGWMVELRVADTSALDALMDADGYRASLA
ncbi:MAG TPA: glycine cleavage system protein GcvH [Pseudonocardiaceae bacterium]|nr:glycine cleavage system protein GcvH [Pseudonocardiaceae bacterium]